MWREPRPASADDIPIWFGGKFTPRLVRRVVDLGDGRIPFQGYGESLGEISEKVQLLKQALRDANRDPHTLDVAYWMRTLRRPDCLALVPARRPRVIRSPGITRYSRLCSLAARPGRTECARSCRRARAARGWHPDSASDRQLRESGRLGCLDPVGAALAGIRNVGCGPPAPLPSRCLSMAGTLGARVGVTGPGADVLARPAGRGGATGLESAPARRAALRHPTGGGAAGTRIGDCQPVTLLSGERRRMSATARDYLEQPPNPDAAGPYLLIANGWPKSTSTTLASAWRSNSTNTSSNVLTSESMTN